MDILMLKLIIKASLYYNNKKQEYFSKPPIFTKLN